MGLELTRLERLALDLVVFLEMELGELGLKHEGQLAHVQFRYDDPLEVRENLPQLREALRELPAILNHVGEQVAEGRIRFNLQSPELREINKQLEGQRLQRYWLAAAATSAVTGALVMTLGPVPFIGWALLGAAAMFAFIARP